jgi:hypothetical protein
LGFEACGHRRPGAGERVADAQGKAEGAGMSDEWERLEEAILAIGAPDDQSDRHTAWRELRRFLAEHLIHDEFIALLERLHAPLDRWLWDKGPPSPKMAFDVKPKPRAIEMAADFVRAFVHGQYDCQTNNEIEKFLVKILANEKEDTKSVPVLIMQRTYDVLRREGAITFGMSIAEKHRAVLDKLGGKESERGYGYETFRINVLRG